MQRQSTTPDRALVPGMRWMLVGFIMLPLVAGIQLFVLAEHTDRFFA